MSEMLTIAQIKPLAGYVLIEPEQGEKKTASGIVYQAAAVDKQQIGTVVAVGGAITIDGVEVKCPVKVNDQVLYINSFVQQNGIVKIGAKEYQFLKFADLLAVVGK